MDNEPVAPPRNIRRRFLQLLTDEIDKGYTRGSTLKGESWKYIRNQLNTEYGAPIFRVRWLKKCLQNIKNRYNYFSALLALDGVKWNVSTNKVRAKESVWKAYYEAHPNAPSYRLRGEKYFDLLCQIFESGVLFD